VKTVVPTSHTRLLAARMVDAVTECTTPADVTTDLLPQCRAGQEVALVATLLGHATNHNTVTSSDNNEAETEGREVSRQEGLMATHQVEARIENIRFLADAGLNRRAIAARLGLTVQTLDAFASRHDFGAEWLEIPA
jgi:hypothetical protein